MLIALSLHADCPTLTLLKQVRLFTGVSVVVGLHGAGLSNIVFSRPGSAVIEMGAWGPHNDGRGPPPCFANMAHRLGLWYHRHPRHEFSPRLAALVSYYTEHAPVDDGWEPPPLPACNGWCGTGLPPQPGKCGRPLMTAEEKQALQAPRGTDLVCEPYVGGGNITICVLPFKWNPR